MKTLYSRGNNYRKPEYQILTSLIMNNDGKKIIHKVARDKRAINHLSQLAKNNKLICSQSRLISVPKLLKSGKDYVDFEFIDNSFSLEQKIEQMIINKDFLGTNIFIEKVLNLVRSLTDTNINPYANKAFQSIFDPKKNYYENGSIDCCQSGIIDINFDNILVAPHNKLYLIDNEWVFNFPVPIDYICFRSIFSLSIKLQRIIQTSCSNLFPCYEIVNNTYIPKIWLDTIKYSQVKIKKFLFYESNFQKYVNIFRRTNDYNLVLNEKKLTTTIKTNSLIYKKNEIDDISSNNATNKSPNIRSKIKVLDYLFKKFR